MRRTQTTPRYLLLRPQHHYLAGKYHCRDYCTCRYLRHCCKLVVQSLTLCVQIAVRGLDHCRTRAQAAIVVNLRRRITSSEAAKQEAEPQSNKRRTRLPRVQVQEVRSLATSLTFMVLVIRTKEMHLQSLRSPA